MPYPWPDPGCGARGPVGDEVTEELQTIPEYAALRARLLAAINASPRQALSAHTTTECQVGKEVGPVASLKSAGLETPIQTPQGVRVHVNLPNMFTANDGLGFVYCSIPHRNLKLAQAQATRTYVFSPFVGTPSQP